MLAILGGRAICGLMTQGMVCHQSFKVADGQWLFPEEVEKEGSDWRHKQTGKAVKLAVSRK